MSSPQDPLPRDPKNLVNDGSDAPDDEAWVKAWANHVEPATATAVPTPPSQLPEMNHAKFTAEYLGPKS